MCDVHLESDKVVQPRIKLDKTDSHLIQFTLYHAGPRAKRSKPQEIDMLIVIEVFEPLQTEWVWQNVFVPKKDDTRRLCVNYWKLNAVTISVSYPIRHTNECINLLEDGTIFLTLNANSGYWQENIA